MISGFDVWGLECIRKTRPRQGGKSIAENSESRFDLQISCLSSRLFFHDTTAILFPVSLDGFGFF
jgi:hypothetical protein